MDESENTKIWNLSPLDKSVIDLVNRGNWLFPYHIDIKRIEESLQEIIKQYPLFCSRLVLSEKLVYSKDKVPFVVEQMPEKTCSNLKAFWKIPKQFQADFKLADFKAGKIPPLSIKIFRLKDGMLISVALSHVCADGAAFYHFVDQWSKLYRNVPTDHPVINQLLLPKMEHDREALLQLLSTNGWFPVGLKALFIHLRDRLFGWDKKAVPPQKIPFAKIEQLREDCFKETGEKFGNHVLLCAWLAKMIASSQKQKHISYTVVSVVDLRGRSAIPENFVGNAVLNVPTSSFDSDSDIHLIAKHINNDLKQTLASAEKLDQRFQLTLESIENKVPFVGFDLMSNIAKNPNCLMINNFCKFPIYSVDFGEGIPTKVFPNDLPDTIKIFPAPPAEKGYYVYFQGNIAQLIKSNKK